MQWSRLTSTQLVWSTHTRDSIRVHMLAMGWKFHAPGHGLPVSYTLQQVSSEGSSHSTGIMSSATVPPAGSLSLPSLPTLQKRLPRSESCGLSCGRPTARRIPLGSVIETSFVNRVPATVRNSGKRWWTCSLQRSRLCKWMQHRYYIPHPRIGNASHVPVHVHPFTLYQSMRAIHVVWIVMYS